MNMIESHMEQIASSAAAICELPFPPPKMFANALLQPHDITALIRDTETHERALFKVAPPEPGSFEPSSRKSTWFSGGEDVVKGDTVFPGLKSNTAVGRILGGDMLERIRRSERSAESRDRADVDIHMLLNGAERLVGIYPVDGAAEKIAAAKNRYEQLKSSIAHYESIVAKQTAELDQASHAGYDDDDFGTSEKVTIGSQSDVAENYRPEDFLREEAEMKELELKKQSLEDRVSGIDRDLDGLR